jgi:Ser/Thr protein kinase RdoA (MazF antagonist)
MKTVARLDNCLVPEILHVDAARHLFVMTYLDPMRYPCWKPLLAENAVGPDFSKAVGSALGRIHRHTAHSELLARQFDNSALFHALRLDPYLLHTANVHQDLKEAIGEIASLLARARIALVHGDISPKNILKGPAGPVFLDAECATYGDPAFDLAFCLNHLLLKCVWHPSYARFYIEAIDRLLNAYFLCLNWEEQESFERRTTRLVAALLLARIDGKSPVEYLTDERQRDFVRRSARTFLVDAELDLVGLRRAWVERLGTQ